MPDTLKERLKHHSAVLLLLAPYKIRALTTFVLAGLWDVLLLAPYKIRALTTRCGKKFCSVQLLAPYKIRALTTYSQNTKIQKCCWHPTKLGH